MLVIFRVRSELGHNFSSQDNRTLAKSILYLRTYFQVKRTLHAIQSVVAQTNEASYFQFTEETVNGLLLIESYSRLMVQGNSVSG